MKIQKLILYISLCTLIIISQTGCMAKNNEPVSDTQYDLLNTTCTITIYDMDKTTAQNLIDQTFDLCLDYEKKLSKTIEGSDVYKINHSNGEPIWVSGSTNMLVQKGLYFGKISEGKFDITVGKLSNLWNFSGDNPKVPKQSEIDEAVKTIDYKALRFEGDTDSVPDAEYEGNVWIENNDSELDLGGIAKGYIADKASEFLIEKGVDSAIVNLGGNIVAIGQKKDGSPWNIGVEKPFSDRSDVVGSVKVKNKTVVTSGIYERMFEENGVLYHHILDVTTGYPAQTDVEAVTLVGELGKSADCDALSTICLMLGVDKGLALIENTPGVEAVFIDKDGKISKTSGMEFSPAK